MSHIAKSPQYNPKAVDKFGRNALIYAAEKSAKAMVYKLLLTAEVDVN